MKTWHLALAVLGLGLATGFGVTPASVAPAAPVAAAAAPAPAAPAAPARPAPPPPRPAPPPPPARPAMPSTSWGPGVVYSQGQMQQALQAAGMSAGNAHIGSAVAMAESHGASGAACNNCAGVAERSYGPWQINLNAHPGVDPVCAQLLSCAAHATYGISSGGTNWRPWSTFLNGAYRRYL